MKTLLIFLASFLTVQFIYAQDPGLTIERSDALGRHLIIGKNTLGDPAMFFTTDAISTYDGLLFAENDILNLQPHGDGNVVLGNSSLGSKENDGRLIVKAKHDTLPDIRLQGLGRMYSEDDLIVHIAANGSNNRKFVITSGNFTSGILGNLSLFSVEQDGDAFLLGDLTVVGEIAAANFPDYVFHPGYQLKNLSQLENEIEHLGHLPDIPSAQEIQVEGMALADMTKRLLRKIEELTLYTIDQQKSIDKANQNIDSLKEINESLQQEIQKIKMPSITKE